MCEHIQACVCVLAQEMRNWGQLECRPTLRDSCLLMSCNKHLTLNPPPHCLVQVDLRDPVCVCACVCVCMHSLPPHQSATAPLLIALHSAHLSTCLLVLVIILVPNKLRLITTAFQWKWSMGVWRWGAGGRKVRRDVMKREVAREWGNKEVRKWVWEAWNPMMGSAQHPEDYSNTNIHRRSGRMYTSAFQNERSSTGKKTDAYFYKMIVVWLQTIFALVLFLCPKYSRQNTERYFYCFLRQKQ